MISLQRFSRGGTLNKCNGNVPVSLERRGRRARPATLVVAGRAPQRYKHAPLNVPGNWLPHNVAGTPLNVAGGPTTFQARASTLQTALQRSGHAPQRSGQPHNVTGTPRNV